MALSKKDISGIISVVGIILAVLVYVVIQTLAINTPPETEPEHIYIDLDTGEQWTEGGVMLEPVEAEVEVEYK